MSNFDCSGWATRNDIKCSDGRTIRKDAFKLNDGQTVPLVWNHGHNDVTNILGHALLENRPEGVYTYMTFNDTEYGKHAKTMVENGDITGLSIYANKLKQTEHGDVQHGIIREVSLVLAGANPGAYIDAIIRHADGSDEDIVAGFVEEKPISLYHADELKEDEKEEEKVAEENKNEKTVKDVLDTLTEEQKKAVYYVIGTVLEENNKEDDENEEEEEMSHNMFEKSNQKETETYLSHADQAEILKRAKNSSVGTFKSALNEYFMENTKLQHSEAIFGSFDLETDGIEVLFPEYKDIKPGAPELLERDQSWVSHVMSKVHKSPISRIRTRQLDARMAELRSLGYKKGAEKKISGQMKLLQRTTDPQTVYRKDSLHRDDIVDITDFDVVGYQYTLMRHNLEEELATAFLIGDGREEVDTDKIKQENIRSIWLDDDLYTIHQDVDIKTAKKELQGTNTSANFGDNYVYAEAIITAALYSREKYKGSGKLDFYCTPHLLNVMLLARDLNGRRIYDSTTDLAAALNVNEIHAVEQMEGKTRETEDNKTKKLLGLFVNLSDYHVGCARGGEITKFSQFDIDFNKEKYLLETRLSAALTKVYSAIALEEDITEAA